MKDKMVIKIWAVHGKMSCSKKQYFKAAIFIAATFLFLLQASTQIKKYISHETTFASEYKLFDNYEKFEQKKST